eukprot:3542425-Prymnesium_polylepis.1
MFLHGRGAGIGTGTGTALVLPVQGTMVVHEPGRVVLGGSGTVLTGQKYAIIKAEHSTPDRTTGARVGGDPDG